MYLPAYICRSSHWHVQGTHKIWLARWPRCQTTSSSQRRASIFAVDNTDVHRGHCGSRHAVYAACTRRDNLVRAVECLLINKQHIFRWTMRHIRRYHAASPDAHYVRAPLRYFASPTNERVPISHQPFLSSQPAYGRHTSPRPSPLRPWTYYFRYLLSLIGIAELRTRFLHEPFETRTDRLHFFFICKSLNSTKAHD